MRFLVLVLMCCGLWGCNSIPIDPSPSALASNDKSLVFTAGQNGLRQGIDIVRVWEGDPIGQGLQIVVPQGDAVKALEVSAHYNGTKTSFASKNNVLVIPYQQLTKHTEWSLDDDGVVQIYAKVQVEKDSEPLWIDAQAYAYIVVLRKGYSPLPLNSGVEAFKTNCKVQYTTAGRSVAACKNE